MKRFIIIFVIFLAVFFSLCSYESMGATQHAVVFEKLPPVDLGFIKFGGVQDGVIKPKEVEFVYLWESLYRFDTSIQSISWGNIGEGDDPTIADYVQTRALDGNEVGLAITLRYHLNPKKLKHIVEYVAENDLQIREIVEEVALADIRTHMNILKTQDFFNTDARRAAVVRVKDALRARFEPEGIIIDDVFYNDYRFENRYQELIEETQALNQKTEREEKRILTLVEDRRKRKLETQADVNRLVRDANGYKEQARLRGDGYLEAKKNDAKRVAAQGTAEVNALKEKIAALSGPGGKALLRLTLVKELMKNNPQFLLLDSADNNAMGLNLNKTDTNRLLEQVGVVIGASEAEKDSKKQ